ncbi:MAG TPA: hypothetical protein VIL74_10120 [Pyrinomonadaceae bacterium]|jgi:hypothetical protein
MLTPLGLAYEDSKEYIRVRTRRKEDFHFINIDLELESADDLTPLITELEADDRAWSMNLHLFKEDEPKTSVTFEIGWFSKDDDIYRSYDDGENLVGGVDVLLAAFCTLIENLSPDSRRIWDDCRKKDFDVGFQTGNTMKSFRTMIEAETIKRCAALGATISITVYPHSNYEMRDVKDLKKKR